MKKVPASNGRRHGLRSKSPSAVRGRTTALVFESRAQVYCWSTGDSRARLVHKH